MSSMREAFPVPQHPSQGWCPRNIQYVVCRICMLPALHGACYICDFIAPFSSPAGWIPWVLSPSFLGKGVSVLWPQRCPIRSHQEGLLSQGTPPPVLLWWFPPCISQLELHTFTQNNLHTLYLPGKWCFLIQLFLKSSFYAKPLHLRGFKQEKREKQTNLNPKFEYSQISLSRALLEQNTPG